MWGRHGQVLDGSNIVADGTGSIDLGRTDIGTAVTRSFTVRNLGSSALTLGTISLPSGFSLASDFGATTLRGRRRPSACDWTRCAPASTAGRSVSRRATRPEPVQLHDHGDGLAGADARRYRWGFQCNE